MTFTLWQMLEPCFSPEQIVFGSLQGRIHIMICTIESVYSLFLSLPPSSFNAAWGYCCHTCVGGNFVDYEQGAGENNVLFIRTNTSGSRVSAYSYRKWKLRLLKLSRLDCLLDYGGKQEGKKVCSV